MTAAFSDDDVGKRVENANGDEIGIVATVESDTAHVETEPGIVDTIRATLGWEGGREDAVPLGESAVCEITDDAAHLEGEFTESVEANVSGRDRTGGDDRRSEPESEGATDRGSESEPAGMDRDRGNAAERDPAVDPGEETGGAEELGGADGVDALEGPNRGVEVDPSEVTDDDPEAEIRPDEDVGRRTDAAMAPEEGADRSDAEVGRKTVRDAEANPMGELEDDRGTAGTGDEEDTEDERRG